jgi:hypothetical protein
MGSNGRSWIEKTYNWQHDAQVLNYAYQTLKAGTA